MWEEAALNRGPAPNSNFDPADRERRRNWIERKLDYGHHWNQLQWQVMTEAAQLRLCMRLHNSGHDSVGATFFDYTVDWAAWEEYIKLRKLDKYEFSWPWGMIMAPGAYDEREGLSQAYKAWREAEGQPASTPKDPKNPKDPKGAKKPEPKRADPQGSGKPPAQQQGGISSSVWARPRNPAQQQGGPSTSRGPKPPKPGQKQGGSSVTPRVPPKPASDQRATSSGADRKPSSQPAAPAQVAESSAAALARARAGKKPGNVPPHLAHKLGDNTKTKAEPTPDEAHEAALAAANRATANREKISELWSEFQGFSLKEKIAEETIEKAKKEEAAKWKDLEDKSYYRFQARLASLREAGKLEYPVMGSAAAFSNKAPPARQAYRPAFKVDRIPPRCPDLELREQIWDMLEFESPAGPFLGPFELALPRWVDFFDLVLGKEGKLFDRIKDLIPRDVAIAWTKNEDGLPKSLVVGPHPDLGHNAKSGPLRKAVREVWFQVVAWATEVYLARPLRLPDYLKCQETLFERSYVVLNKTTMDDLFHVWNNVPNSGDDLFAFSEARKDNLIRWVPEIHAILKVPEEQVELVLQDWVMEGHQTESSLRERIEAVVDHWGESSPVQAHKWQKLVELAIFKDQ
ncbi:unnamed protein product [Fusarium equiseti]|uniref:Uncharacterized protein n=1 Tax=Fusarium equiseti TaxID=61235 RepID=A0A8J2J2S9_FUSEQ|nr:unnamed protein product [Fusarium equiseti]